MALTLDCLIDCNGWNELESLETTASETVGIAATESGARLSDDVEVSLLFCDDARIRDLNRQFRGLDKATNVLSFPGPEPLETAHVLGDIAIAFETVKREAVEQGRSLEAHCRHMIVHGFLHLLGHDHEVESEAEVMEALEVRILERLGVSNPYRGEAEKVTNDHERA